MSEPRLNAHDSEGRMQMRVMGNGELYSLKKVYKMVKKFEKMNWIEQQSFFIGISAKIKTPPNGCWTEQKILRKIKNKNFAE